MNVEHRWNPEMGAADFGRADGFVLPAILRQTDLDSAVVGPLFESNGNAIMYTRRSTHARVHTRHGEVGEKDPLPTSPPPTHTHTKMSARARGHTCTHTRGRIHTRGRTHIQTHTQSHNHAHNHTHNYTKMHTIIHTITHTIAHARGGKLPKRTSP